MDFLINLKVQKYKKCTLGFALWDFIYYNIYMKKQINNKMDTKKSRYGTSKKPTNVKKDRTNTNIILIILSFDKKYSLFIDSVICFPHQKTMSSFCSLQKKCRIKREKPRDLADLGA